MFPSNSKILVCDDSTMSRRLLKNILERNGYMSIKEAASAEQLLEFMFNIQINEKLEIDLIFMDIVMPGITGVEFVQKLRKSNSKFNKVPIIMVSAEADRETVMSALISGANEYILKPIDEKSVCNKIQSVWNKILKK